MFIVLSQELGIYFPLDTDSFIDLFQFIGKKNIFMGVCTSWHSLELDIYGYYSDEYRGRDY